MRNKLSLHGVVTIIFIVTLILVSQGLIFSSLILTIVSITFLLFLGGISIGMAKKLDEIRKKKEKE